MATTTARSGRDEEPYSLDHVLSSTEFETSQHEQAIQNELDKIQAYEREIEEKEREIEDFERVVADVGSRKEKVQRQLQLNRDNIESLKHTATVLDDHLEALNKNYQLAIQQTQHKCVEYDGAVSKYVDKWEAYQSTYKKMPKAQQLSAIEETLKQVKSGEAALDAEITEVQKALKALTSEGQEATVKWVLQIASVRVETDATLRLLRSTRQAVCAARKELDTTSAQLLKAKQAVDMSEKEEMNKAECLDDLPSELTTTPMDTSTEVSHSSTTYQNDSCTKDGQPSNVPTSSHDCTAPDGDLPPQNQQPHNISLQSTTHSLVSQQTNTSTTSAGQGKAPGAFAMPQGLPRRFSIPKLPQKPAGITASSVKVSSTATAVNNQVQSAVSDASHRVPMIPPVFQLQSPKPPSSSPKLLIPPSSGGGKAKMSFELPKISIPRHSQDSITSSSSLSQSQPQRVGGQVHNSSEQNVPTLSNMKPSQSVSSRYQLKLPSKPVPPFSPRITSPKPCMSRPPPKSFTLPPMSELSTRTSQSSGTQRHLPGTGVVSQGGLSSSSQGGLNSASQGGLNSASQGGLNSAPPEGLSKSTAPTSTSNAGIVDVSPLDFHTTLQESQEQQKQYEPSSDPLPQYMGIYQHGLQQQQLQSKEAPHDQMEVSSVPDHLAEGEEGGVEMMDEVFNPASTSIDFGEQSVDFDSSGPLFALQSDDTFNISQTEPFFNMNQGTPESTGGFSFMQMTLNEDESSSTNIQDFFSQFGKTDTSSHSETAGKFLF